MRVESQQGVPQGGGTAGALLEPEGRGSWAESWRGQGEGGACGRDQGDCMYICVSVCMYFNAVLFCYVLVVFNVLVSICFDFAFSVLL